jgi:hypothetical protein
MTEVEAEVEQAKELIGFTITGVCHTKDNESFGLVVKKGRVCKTVWVDCDPEGNGPGHLNIENDNL